MWVISPGSSASSTYADLSKVTTFRNAYSSSPSSPLATSVGIIDTFNFTIQFLPSNQSSLSPQCRRETVLIYDGLPQFLNTFRETFHEGTGVPSGSTNQGKRLLPKVEKLLAYFTGSQLRHASFSAMSALLTVVYYYDDGGNAEVGEGFDAQVRVQQLDEVEAEEEVEVGHAMLDVLSTTNNV